MKLRVLTATVCRLSIALSAFAGVAAAVSPAFAQEAAPADVAAEAPAADAGPDAAKREEAGQRYDRGLKLYSEADYALAVIEFERAYELVPDFRVLYNIGQVRIQLANYAKARRALEQYLKEGGDRVSADRKQAVENDLEMLASRTGFLRVDTNVDGAEIVVDEVIVGTSPLAEPLLLDAGEHRLSVRKAGYYPRSSQTTLAGRDSLSVRLDLEKQPVASNRIIFQPQKEDDSTREAWMWGTWSATGVFAVGAAVTGGLGMKAANDLEDQRTELGSTRDELDSSERRARTLLMTADVLAGLAVATGGVALYLTLTQPDEPGKEKSKAPGPKPPPKRVALAVRPNWVGLAGSY
jgi:hypothetical protein